MNANINFAAVEENASREVTCKILRPKCPKDLLESKKIIKVGDFVTTKDDNDVVEVFIAESIEGESINLCGIKLTEEKDDIITFRFSAHYSELLYLDESFVRVNGILWNLREEIVSNK